MTETGGDPPRTPTSAAEALLKEVAEASAVLSTTECAAHGPSCDCDRVGCLPESRVIAYGIKPELMGRIRKAVQ